MPSLPPLEVCLLLLLGLLLALNLLTWHCNKAMLTAVYDTPQLFYLQLPHDGGISPHGAAPAATHPAPKRQ